MQVPKQLRESFLEAVKAGRIRSMQNKLMPAAPIHTPGALLLGDAFNMRHPLTGQHLCVAFGPFEVEGAAAVQPPLELSEGFLRDCCSKQCKRATCCNSCSSPPAAA